MNPGNHPAWAAAIAINERTNATKVNPAFHPVVTRHGSAPVHRAVANALAENGVIPTPTPHPNMHEKANTEGATPTALGSGTAAPMIATTAIGFKPSNDVAIKTTGTANGTRTPPPGISPANPPAGNAIPSVTPKNPLHANNAASPRNDGNRA